MKVLVDANRTFLKIDGQPFTKLVVDGKGTTLKAGGTAFNKVQVIQDTIKVIQVGVQGPRGPAGRSTPCYEFVVDASDTHEVETFQASERVRQWKVFLQDVVDPQLTMSYIVRASSNGVDITASKYAIIGTRIKHSLDCAINDNYVSFSLTNEHSEALAAKIKVAT